MQPGAIPPGPSSLPPPPAPRRGMPWWGWLILGLLAVPCVLGTLAAMAVPALQRYARRAKATEATSNLALLCRVTSGYATEHGALPPGAAMTPAEVPAGTRAVDAPDAWNAPGWQAVGFSMHDAHYFSYELVTSGSTFVVRAYGDLDGDHVLSTFERTGTFTPNEGATCGELHATNETE